MESREQGWLAAGIILILATGVIHVIEAPDALQEAAYKGWLFYANGAGALLAAGGIFMRQRWAWPLGLMVVAGAISGYVASRTIGLPGLPAEPGAWFEPMGVASLVAEAGFIAVMALSGKCCCCCLKK